MESEEPRTNVNDDWTVVVVVVSWMKPSWWIGTMRTSSIISMLVVVRVSFEDRIHSSCDCSSSLSLSLEVGLYVVVVVGCW